MKKRISLRTFVRLSLILVLIFTVSVNLLTAGKIETKDGSVINGKILSIEEGVIKVETSYAGEITIKQSEVVTFSSSEII